MIYCVAAAINACQESEKRWRKKVSGKAENVKAKTAWIAKKKRKKKALENNKFLRSYDDVKRML